MIYFVTPYIYAQTKRYTAVEKKRVLFVATYFLEEELLSVLMSIVWILLIAVCLKNLDISKYKLP